MNKPSNWHQLTEEQQQQWIQTEEQRRSRAARVDKAGRYCDDSPPVLDERIAELERLVMQALAERDQARADAEEVRQRLAMLETPLAATEQPPANPEDIVFPAPEAPPAAGERKRRRD